MDIYRELAQRQVSLSERLDHLDCDDLLLHLQNDYSSLWQRIQGLVLPCCGAVLEIAVCCSLLQLQLLLVLRDGSPSHGDHAHLYLHQLMQRLKVHFVVDDDDRKEDLLVASVMHHSLSNDFTRRAIAYVCIMVSIIEFMSASLHERASKRLAMVHELLSSGDHESCRDWFECLLRTKASLSGEHCSEEINYFTGWWSKDFVSADPPLSNCWSETLTHLHCGNSLAQQGRLQLALGKYRQCLLRPGFLCAAPAIANSAMLFQRMNNVDGELETRTLLLKALHHMTSHCLERNNLKYIIWRKDCHVSTKCGIYSDHTWWSRNVYVTALRAVHCKRPQLAVSLLEGGSDVISSYGLVPSLLLLRSLVELGRGSEAIDVCLNVITRWKSLDQLADVEVGLQMAQILLFASIAAIACKQYDLAHLLAIRCAGLCTSMYSLAQPSMSQQCTQCMQLSLCVRAVVLVGAGRLTSALSLLTCGAVSESHKSVVLCYNLALLKVKLAYNSSTLTQQMLTALRNSLRDTTSGSIKVKVHSQSISVGAGDHSTN